MSFDPTVSTGTTAPAAEPDTDPVLWDPERAARTIKAQRFSEHESKKTIAWLRDSLQAVAAGRPLTAAQEAAIAHVTPTAPAEAATGNDSTLQSVAAILGVDASDSAAMVDAARQIRLSQELGDLFHAQHLDVALSRAAINDGRLLAAVDVAAPDLHNTLENIFTDLVAKHPQLRLRANGPATTITPMPAGSGGAGPAPLVTKESLKFLDAETINQLRTSGQLSHLDVGSG